MDQMRHTAEGSSDNQPYMWRLSPPGACSLSAVSHSRRITEEVSSCVTMSKDLPKKPAESAGNSNLNWLARCTLSVNNWFRHHIKISKSQKGVLKISYFMSFAEILASFYISWRTVNFFFEILAVILGIFAELHPVKFTTVVMVVFHFKYGVS